MKNFIHHNVKSMGVMSFFVCNGTVPSWGNGRQSQPKCVAYLQSIPLFCFGCCHCRKSRFTQIRCWKWQQGFQCCGGNPRVFCHDFKPEHRKSCCLEHTFKVTVICDLQQLIFFLHGHTGFARFIDKLVADPSLDSSWVLCCWEVVLKLF